MNAKKFRRTGAALAILSLLPFWGVLANPGRFLGVRDLLRSLMPAKLFWVQQVLAHGRVPFWNPWLNGGREFLADLSVGPLYVMNLVLLPFGEKYFLWGFSWFIALHLPLLFLGALCFLRSFSVQRPVALALALAYAWSGLAVSSANVPNILATMGALPLFLGALRFWVLRGSWAGLLGAGLGLAWPIYNGAPDFTLFMGLSMPFALARGRRIPLAYARALGAAGLALLLSLPQLIPSLPLLRHTDRAAGLGLDQVLLFSVHPLRILELFLGEFFGNVVPEDTYWGNSLPGGRGDIPLMFSCYLGFFLPGCILLAHFRRKPWHRKTVRFLLPASLALLLAVGKYGFLYRLIASHFIWWRVFRYPEKWLCLAALPLLAICATGLQRWTASLRTRAPGKGLLVPGALPLAISSLSLLFLSPLLPATVKGALLAFSVLQAIFAFLLFASLSRRIEARLALVLFGLVAGADLFRNSINIVWDSPAWVLENPAAEAIRRDLEARAGEVAAGGPARVASVGIGILNGQESGAPENLDGVGKTMYLSAHRFVPNVASLYGLADVGWYNGIMRVEREAWWENLATRNMPRLLDLMGAYYLPQPENGGFSRNEGALRFVSVPPEVRFVPDFAAALEALRAESFDGKKTLLVEGSPFAVSRAEALHVRLERGPDSLRIEVHGTQKAPGPILLLVNEAYAPGWTCRPACRIAGRANGWALAVEVPSAEAGAIELRFQGDR